MHTKSMAFAAGAALALSLAPGVFAQTAGQAPSQGPAIPGLCVFSGAQATTDSTVGQYVNTRLQQIASQIKAELDPEQNAITAEDRRLSAQRATMAQATFQTQAQALQNRVVALQNKAGLRQQEFQETERKALNRIAQELEPIVRQLYQQRRCSVLIDKQAALLSNTDMDLTPQAVTMLNQRLTQFPFELETITPNAAPARR